MPVSGSMSGSVPGERSAAFCRVRCLLSYPKEFYVLFFAVSGLVRSRVSDGLSERFGFAASRSGAGLSKPGDEPAVRRFVFPPGAFLCIGRRMYKIRCGHFSRSAGAWKCMVTARNLCDRLYGNCWANRYYVRMTETNGCRFRPFRHNPVCRHSACPA